MFHRWAALGLVLALWAMLPKNAAGQGTTQPPRGPSAGVRVPYPNPFNPEIHIPFTVGTAGCSDAGLQHQVTVQVKNVLAQVIATPVLEAATPFGTSGVSVSADGRTPIARLRLGCGEYTAFWDGKVLGTGKEAPSGMYLVLVIEDGKVTQTWRIFNRK